MDSILLAIAAPAFIGLGAIFSGELRHSFSVIGLTVFRVGVALLFLIAAAAFSGSWRELSAAHLPLLLSSGVVGLVVSDATLSASIFAIGASNAMVVFSLNAVFAAFLGWLVLGEYLAIFDAVGIALVISGVVLALSNVRDSDISLINPSLVVSGLQDRRLRAQLILGIGLGVASAFTQAMSGMLARPVMATGIGPDTAMAVRLGAALLVLVPLMLLRREKAIRQKLTRRTILIGLLSAGFGIACGVTFFFASLEHVNIATAATLASTTPLWVMQMNWIRTGIFPGWRPVAGACLCVLGAYLILS